MAITDLDQLSFELERFEWRGDDRLEVTGRWYGLRGQRFVRPTLHVREGSRRRRMIAVLDHKPWSAEEDATWIAAFTCRGDHDGITSARLEVAPDIILELPLPGTAEPGTTLTPRPRRAEKASRAAAAARAEAEKPPATAAPTDSPPPAAADAPPAAPADPSPPVAAPADSPEVRAGFEFAMLALERELDEERGERARLSAELELARRQLETAAAHHASAVERANELVRLEGELAAALARADELAAALERAESARVAALELARADRERADEARVASPAEPVLEAEVEALREELAEARSPVPVRPLPRRVRPRAAGHRQWGLAMRLSVLAVVIALLVVLLVILT